MAGRIYAFDTFFGSFSWNTYIVSTDSMKQDTVMLVYLKSKERINEKEQLKIREWLGARVNAKNIKLLIE